MLQQDKPDDYVIATGKATSVREFLIRCFDYIGIEIDFTGNGIDEKGLISSIDEDKFYNKIGIKPDHLKAGQQVLAIDPYYYRPTEVDLLIGDASKAREKLGWKPEYDLEMLIDDMMKSDIKLMQKNDYLKKGGFVLTPSIEDML